ncbi:hypothetical protein DFA_01441 [Cavenderia fasciculata]|uniref:N-acetyltransferase domain-containing protein n=1 Tax=Cavenderia fasciculata TaxID=261658 RepID=F4PSS7_CACFS|nr:uncharacterized protein DFA_01441 [Cavenderia fasciculata]EGG21555.1 hypothetical protein DFA_01441 [Cavenderia fasciculata]|eukprot:XP_004359405.1 hypothetical protein DFA_01441 [Cavenderia fasciculata]
MNININNNNNRFVLREFSEEKDLNAISSIPRLPVSYNYNALEGMSHPIDFTIRPTLTKNHKIIVAEDRQEHQAVGAYACNIKDVIVCGEKKTLYYMFDINVHPEYRGHSISNMFFRDIHSAVKQDNRSTILVASTSKNNAPIKKATGNIEMTPQYDQCQMAWKVSSPVKVNSLPSNCSQVRFMKVIENEDVKIRWDNAFQQYNFIPSSFSDILVDNQKYHESTYIATMQCNGQLYEASISIWNQDLIFTLKNRQQQTQKHRQLYCCYSLGEDQETSDTLFRYLLQRVHNELYSQGINYVFAGFSMTDPIRQHFPLLPGIKSLEFTSIARFSTPTEFTQFKSQSNYPIWNDPRDYGILMLYPEQQQQQNNNFKQQPFIRLTDQWMI